MCVHLYGTKVLSKQLKVENEKKRETKNRLLFTKSVLNVRVFSTFFRHKLICKVTSVLRKQLFSPTFLSPWPWQGCKPLFLHNFRRKLKYFLSRWLHLLKIHLDYIILSRHRLFRLANWLSKKKRCFFQFAFAVKIEFLNKSSNISYWERQTSELKKNMVFTFYYTFLYVTIYINIHRYLF